MVKHSDAALDATFAALAHPTRRAILARLADGETTVKELAEPFDVSAPAISRHLRILEDAGLLSREIDGRVHHMELEAEPLADALDWIARYGRFWEERLDALERLVADQPQTERRR